MKYTKRTIEGIEQDEYRIELMQKYLDSFGFDKNDPDLKETARRIVDMHDELMYAAIIEDKVFDNEINHIMEVDFPINNDNMVVINGIETTSMCPHHFAPIKINASIVYIPNDGKVVGLSKIPRLIDFLSKRPIMQEVLTEEIAATIEHKIKTKGVMVVIKGSHSCMSDRGVKTRGSVTTSAIKGVFRSVAEARQEALRLIE